MRVKSDVALDLQAYQRSGDVIMKFGDVIMKFEILLRKILDVQIVQKIKCCKWILDWSQLTGGIQDVSGKSSGGITFLSQMNHSNPGLRSLKGNLGHSWWVNKTCTSVPCNNNPLILHQIFYAIKKIPKTKPPQNSQSINSHFIWKQKEIYSVISVLKYPLAS